MAELGGGQRPVLVDRVDSQALQRDVIVMPQVQRREGVEFGAGRDLDDLRRDDAPTAFGLDAPHARDSVRGDVAGAVAMGHLVKAVGRRDRADFDLLEEYVVARVAASHGLSLRCKL